jgi:predicted DNA binding protein
MKFPQQSLLDKLTPKQREVILSAFAYGYYNIPRLISSEELAKKLGIHSSALIEHRRKAEHSLLSAISNYP